MALMVRMKTPFGKGLSSPCFRRQGFVSSRNIRPSLLSTFFPDKAQCAPKGGTAAEVPPVCGTRPPLRTFVREKTRRRYPSTEKRSRDWSTLARNALVSREESFLRSVSRTCSGVIALIAAKAASCDLPNVRSIPPVPML